MAVIRDDVIVSPSVDIITLTEANSVTLEPGIYTINESVTINGLTNTRWTVICIGNNVGSAPVCYTQLWMPSAAGETTNTIYMRTINSAGTGYSNFKTLTNSDNAVVNQTSYPTEIYVQTTQPTAVAGKNIIWIDTSS